MPQITLITGGAGFIGGYIASELMQRGQQVRVLDCLDPQVHPNRVPPTYLPDDVDLVVGDVRDPEALDRALQGVHRVVHLAARVGVGQSMYEMADYTSVNTCGTAVLLEALLRHDVERLVVASSMSVYGEGAYRRSDGTDAGPVRRPRWQLENRLWDPVGPDGERLVPVPTPESKRPDLSSVYALSKFDQEQLCLVFGQSYGVPTIALRFFNVYGPHQALSNPYTGVLAIFAARLLNGRPPLIFEDGGQKRDFVSVLDVARAVALALDSGASGCAVNVGSGRSTTISEVAAGLIALLGASDVGSLVGGKYRAGDIRHCFADISLARQLLGYEPRVELEDGMADLAAWLEGQVAEDGVERAAAELARRGLTV